MILDEIQYAPQLLPYIKDRIDADRRPGLWLLTGSQSFPLMRGVSQSLAGRIAVLTLDPLERDTTGDREPAAAAPISRHPPVALAGLGKLTVDERRFDKALALLEEAAGEAAGARDAEAVWMTSMELAAGQLAAGRLEEVEATLGRN